MRLITILTVLGTCSGNELNLPQLTRPYFPLQYQPQNSASDGNVFLPPDSPTALPLFTKNTNELQYQYLPPTGTKAPSKYPPIFPVFSTVTPLRENDDDEDDRTFVTPDPAIEKLNKSQNNPASKDFQNRPIPKNLAYFDQVDRIDAKYPASLGHGIASTASPFIFPNQMLQNRRMVQPPPGMPGNHQHEQSMPDHMKAASFQAHQFVQPPQQSTEAIPILRLSNEMDLDGSYSYEALSADQTHVIQHGHVENPNTDQAENVVEGSYSYVGDNGQTYTVHYIADANGFRASGDHLPVAPPIPEIIQRAVEYNIAEESRNPQSQVPFHEEGGNVKRHFINHQPPPMFAPPPPPRNPFAGRPEAFSHKMNIANSTPGNNVQPAPAASTQTPVIHYESPKEALPAPMGQHTPSANGGTISPQITFLASQGAHDPDKSISRVYAQPHIEGPIFRFGNMKNRLDQAKQEFRTRWQYENPFLYESATKIPNTKNFISRSSVETGDDVMINFSDMSPDQYSRMYHSQIKPKEDDYEEQERIPQQKQFQQNLQSSSGQQEKEEQVPRDYPTNLYGNPQKLNSEHQQYIQAQYHNNQNWYKNQDPYQAYTASLEGRAINSNNKQSLITKDSFIPPSQTVTRSYDYSNDLLEGRQLQFNQNYESIQDIAPTSTTTKYYGDEFNTDYNTTNFEIYKSNKRPYVSTTEIQQFTQTISLPPPTTQNLNSIPPVPKKFQDVTTKESPIPETTHSSVDFSTSYKTTTEEDINEAIEENIFLKSLIKSNSSSKEMPQQKSDGWRPSQSLPDTVEEITHNRDIKHLNTKPKLNNFNGLNKKSIDLSQVANLVSLKNFFESNKISPKKEFNYNTRLHDVPKNLLENVNKVKSEPAYYKSNSFSGNSLTKHEDVERMMGVAKIYKTLQRNIKLHERAPSELNTDLVPPAQYHRPANINNNQHSLPPLGRAGPSMKSYLPPVFS